MNPSWPNRKSHRLRGYNYAGPGTYFVTICTADRCHYFGVVRRKTMFCSDWGKIAAREWQVSIYRRPHIIPHAFVVMPNHVHGLVSFDPATTSDRDLDAIKRGLPPQSLGRFLNGFKGAVTTVIRAQLEDPYFEVWQSNYHDRVVRDEREFDSFHAYILDNPARWEEDRFNNERM